MEEKPKRHGIENLKPLKPGQTANPNGRPKGSRNLSTILREMLDENVEVTIDGVKSKKQFKEVIIRKLLKKANDGDLRAIQEIFDRIEGKPISTHQVDTDGTITIEYKDGLSGLIKPHGGN